MNRFYSVPLVLLLSLPVLIASFFFPMSIAKAGGAVIDGVNVGENPAGNMLVVFIEAFNSGDENRFTDFATSQYANGDDPEALARRLEVFNMVYTDTKGFRLHKIENTDELSLTAIVEAIEPSQFEWLKLGIELDEQPPHLLKAISFRPANNPNEAPLPDGKLSDEEIAGWLEEYMQKLSDDDKFSGAVLLARDGRPIFKKAYGLACKRYNFPNNIDTKFNLGSMNKMFTGVAVAQLAERGLLSFDDTVGKYLQDYSNDDVREKVTIHHLLTHTSGLGSYWPVGADSGWANFRTVAEHCSLFVHEPLMFEPGEKFAYSNSGPIVLGLIIEAISGMSYYDYIAENIYNPAGMANSGCFEVDLPVENLAIGYTKLGHDAETSGYPRKNNLFMHAVKGGPAGGGYSTVGDLLKFANALTSNRLLSAAYTDTVTIGKVEMGPGMKYAYLFGDEIYNGQGMFGHNGGAPGMNSALRIFPESGYTIAVMSNYDPPASEKVAEKLTELLIR